MASRTTDGDPDVQVLVSEDPPVRLDRFLARQLPAGSRQHARELIAADAVRINGRRARKGQVVHPGDVVRIAAGVAAMPRELAGEADLLVPILFEDDAVFAVDKPGGMPTHALRPDERGTVANFLVARFPEVRRVGRSELEAGLAHRLDTGTSGVLVGARTTPAYQDLRRQFGLRRVRKAYLAVVRGDVASAGTIDTPIAHDRRRRRRMRACSNPDAARAWKARPAFTAYRPLRRFGVATLLAIRISTGVRHQVRVHLASIGHPLAGDRVYDRALAQPFPLPRPLLHATRLCLQHPVRREALTIDAPVPADFQTVLRRLAGG